MSEKGHLLDDVAVEVGCPCLSDLRANQYRSSLLKALKHTFPQQYSLQDWQDAAEYLLGEGGKVVQPELSMDPPKIWAFLISSLETSK